MRIRTIAAYVAAPLAMLGILSSAGPALGAGAPPVDLLASRVHPDTVDCPTDGHTKNPQVNIWVHVSPAGVPTIQSHAHITCVTVPNAIHGKVHFQRMVFEPGHPAQPGRWKEIVATRVYSGLNSHMQLIVPAHHIRWRPGRFRAAFEVWGFSSGSPPGGNRYGSGYWCSSNLDIPKGPPPTASFKVTISPDTHLCDPPLGHVITMAHRTTPPLNHQFCLSEGRHLCMAMLHPGINSRMVLRVNGRTQSQAIVFVNGRLLLKRHPGWCVGGDSHLVEPRAAHCNGGHGVRWRKIVFQFRGIGFDNVAADRADPGPRQHFLAAVSQFPGAALAIASNLHLPHVWRDCAGHCTRPAHATLTRARSHTQYCLQDGRHLCMYVLHPGLNSRVVLRPDRNVRAEDISLVGGQLVALGYHNRCIGPNARTMHCNQPGTGWQGVVAHDSTWKFWNVADTIHSPHHRAHWLIAQTDDVGFPLTVSTQYWWPHKWFTCFGHCTRPAHAALTSFHPKADRALGCAITMKFRQLILNGRAVKQAYARTDCTTKPDSFHAKLSIQQRTGGRWHTRASAPADSRSPFPHRYYWLNKTCGAGTWRARLTVTGSNHDGVALTSPVSFYSKPKTISNCVSGGTASQPVLPVLA